MKKELLVAGMFLAASLLTPNAHAQWSTTSKDNYDGTCRDKTDQVLHNRYRFGILNRGNWGGATALDQYVNIGPGDMSDITGPGTTINAPVGHGLYGLTASMDSDRMFVGLRSREEFSDCTDLYPTNNSADGIIAWGNDEDDRLIFEFHHWQYPMNPPVEIATMLPNGFVGIGTPTPTEQLHTTYGVRFEGIPATTFDSSHTVVVRDPSGVLYHTTLSGGGGVTNNCATTDFLTKTDPSGNLSCSQVYDDGTSVGIATTTGTVGGTFSYTLGAGYGTLLGTIATTPSSGTVKLDVNGVTRGLAFLAYSDEKLKANIKPVENALDIIKKLNGKTYDWNETAKTNFNADNGRHVGFIAQELAEVVPEIVVKDEAGNYAVNYTELIPVLSESIKEQQVMIEELKAEIIALKQATGMSDVETDANNFSIFPNPSNQAVNIRVEQLSDNSMIMITDLNGKLVKRVASADFADNTYNIAKGTFTPGVYLVTLIGDNVAQGTQRLVITE